MCATTFLAAQPLYPTCCSEKLPTSELDYAMIVTMVKAVVQLSNIVALLILSDLVVLVAVIALWLDVVVNTSSAVVAVVVLKLVVLVIASEV